MGWGLGPEERKQLSPISHRQAMVVGNVNMPDSNLSFGCQGDNDVLTAVSGLKHQAPIQSAA
jgi:hypothetical protein